MKTLFASLVLLSVFASAALAVEYPKFQRRMVNDFVGKLDAPAKERIEKILRDFEKRTTNEFIVAIVPDLQGMDVEGYANGLFHEWGIGKKGKDNGMLLLISMKERKTRIEVGRGLEGELTDLKSGRILRNVLKPELKRGDFAGGIEKTLAAAMNIVAPPPPKVMTPEEKQRIAQQHKEAYRAMLAGQKAQQQRKERIVSGIKTFGFSLVSCFVIIFCGAKLRKKIVRRRQRQLMIEKNREQLVGYLADASRVIGEVNSSVTSLRAMAQGLPAWAKKEIDPKLDLVAKQSAEISLTIAEQQKRIVMAEEDGLQDCENVVRLVSHLTAKLKKGYGEIEKLIKTIKAETQNANILVVSLNDSIDAVSKLSQQMQSEGYQIDVAGQLKREKESLESLKSEMEKDSDIRPISKKLDEMNTRIAEVKKGLDGMKIMREQNDRMISNIPVRVGSLKEEVSKAASLLDQLKRDNPENVWNALSSAYVGIPVLIEQVQNLTSAAQRKNSIQEQQFKAAAEDIRKVEETLEKVLGVCKDIHSLDAEVLKAKEEYPKLLAKAEESIEDANPLVRHSDADSKHRRNLEEARGKINQAKSAAQKGGLVDWLAVVALLAGATAISANAVKLAKQDIEAAAEAARALARRREEEHEARIRQEDDERRRSDSYNSSSSSDYSSSSSSSGFDCGGGDSGGGGASGDW